MAPRAALAYFDIGRSFPYTPCKHLAKTWHQTEVPVALDLLQCLHVIEEEAHVLADPVDRARGEGDREDGLEPIDGAVAPLIRIL